MPAANMSSYVPVAALKPVFMSSLSNTCKRVIGIVMRTDRRLGAEPSDCTLAAQQTRMRLQAAGGRGT